MTAPSAPSPPAILEVTECFRSLQGETSLAGRAATFLRLTGCNLRCRWCDTPHAYAGGVSRPVTALVAELLAAPASHLIVITGGEPLLQPALPELLAPLLAAGRQVLLETNGSQDVRQLDRRLGRIVDLKCPGSGAADTLFRPNLDDLGAGDELKCVLADEADFRYALGVIRRHGLAGRCELLCSPVAGRLEPRELAAWILAEPEPLRLQLQLHRLLWPERERGV